MNLHQEIHFEAAICDHLARHGGFPSLEQQGLGGFPVLDGFDGAILENGHARGFEMERHVRDMLLMPIIGGSSAIQKNNIANRMGLPKA